MFTLLGFSNGSQWKHTNRCVLFLIFTLKSLYNDINNYRFQAAAVNLFGAIRVTKAFLPLIRKNHGRIVNVSSILGRVADPFMGAYCITKYGLEAFSDALRLEMKKFNVKVSLIEPGNFLSATNVIAGKDGLIAMAHRTWEQLDESIKKDYGKESLERQIRMGEILMNLSVSFFYRLE